MLNFFLLKDETIDLLNMDLITKFYDYGIVEKGNFTLKSGKKSDVYIDLRKSMSFPNVHKNICDKLAAKIDLTDNLLICGTPYGAISYTSYISITKNIPMIFLRKEQKNYGTKKSIEGVFRSGDRVVLIEDVITSGQSVIESAQRLEKEGLSIVQIIAVVSRADQQIKYKDIDIECLYHINDMNKYLDKQNHLVPNTILNTITNLNLTDKSTNLNSIISFKNTRICLAADVTTMNQLVTLIEQVAHHFCILKIHSDIIEDFYQDFENNCHKLRKLSKHYQFLIWEDRKLADIGSIMEKQILHIKNWADIISVHPISGYMSIQRISDIKLILIAEMSTSDHLFNDQYKDNVIDIANKHDAVIGIVSQHKYGLAENKLYFVPGISNSLTSDSQGQRYSSPKDRKFADIFVIGRSIYLANNPLKQINVYKQIINKFKN